MYIPWRGKIRSSRYSGKWSAYLLVMTWANSPGPGRPFSIGRAGSFACSTPLSRLRHAYLGRTYSVTMKEAGT